MKLAKINNFSGTVLYKKTSAKLVFDVAGKHRHAAFYAGQQAKILKTEHKPRAIAAFRM